jgi:flagellar biogenesis protein FliO
MQMKEFVRSDFLRRVGNWLAVHSHPWGKGRERQLRLCENLALGERRFLSVVECGHQRFLVGGSANSVAVLAELAGGANSAKKAGEDVPTYKFVGGELTKDVLCG